MADKKEVFKQLVTELRNQNTDELIMKVAENLKNTYEIPEGTVISMLARNLDERFFETTDIRLITLFIMEAFKVFGRSKNIDKYITKGEQTEARKYDYNAQFKRNDIKLPVTFEPVVRVNNVFSTKMSVQEIVQLVDAGVINYNFDIQREATLELRNDKMIKKPTINQTNVREMRQLLLNDSLKESTIYLNAAPLSALEGDELIYDPSNYALTITEGTQLDVLDGFHRILAAQKAYLTNPTIDFEFNVMFSNFTTEEAIRWQAQHSKATAWSINRVSELQQESKGAKVAKAIRDKDVELEKMIYTGKNVTQLPKDAVVTFNVLSKIIDENFTIQTRRDEVELSQKIGTLLSVIHEIKSINSTFHSQVIVQAMFDELNKNYGLDIEKYIEHLEKVRDYLLTNNYNFALEGTNQKTRQEDATKKLELLNQKIK